MQTHPIHHASLHATHRHVAPSRIGRNKKVLAQLIALVLLAACVGGLTFLFYLLGR